MVDFFSFAMGRILYYFIGIQQIYQFTYIYIFHF